MATAAPTATGRVIQITGPVVDIEFPPGPLPAIYNAVEIEREGEAPLACEVQQHLGNNWVRSVAMTTTDGLARGTARPRHRRPDHRAGRRGRRSGGSSTSSAARSTARARRPQQDAADPPLRPGLRPADDRGRGLRDRPQGHRPDLPVQEGRQDRDLRRRRRRQDRHHPGADPERRPGARRRVGVRRRRRAEPRGQRPHPRDDRVGRHREDGLRLRPDERAARRPPAGRPDAA